MSTHVVLSPVLYEGLFDLMANMLCQTTVKEMKGSSAI